jgi:hypothetical protein
MGQNTFQAPMMVGQHHQNLPNIIIKQLRLLLHICEAPGSNLVLKTSHPVVSSAPPDNSQNSILN